jgi:hypothetical protein
MMIRGAAGKYMRLLLCAAGVAAAQPYCAPAALSKNADAWPPGAAAGQLAAAPMLCRAAVRSAEYRHGIPRGLLLAIAEVETGRPMADGGGPEPWPWSANAENQSWFFGTRQDAVAWTKQALRRGVASIDSGCLQVNLQQHPDAFASVEQAFDPGPNADYAARFLMQLYRQTGNWNTAVGLYHSHTPTLADPYRARVQAAFAQAVMQRRREILVEMAEAWAWTRQGAPAAMPLKAATPEVDCRTRATPFDAVGAAAMQIAPACPPP